jgi:hypothetical protein
MTRALLPACRQPAPPSVLTQQRERERSESLLIRTVITSIKSLMLMTSFNLNYVQKGQSSKYSEGDKLQHINCRHIIHSLAEW